MSIIIKGMEMPESCSECKVRIALGCCGNLPHNTRVPTCPLVELPPHGDLIDRDKYEVFSYTGTEGRPDTFDDGVMFMLDRLSDAPTIIEAEEVYGQYTDTAGNYHWCGTQSGEHTINPTIIETEEAERAEWYRELSIAHTREIQTALSMDGE